MKYAIKYQKIKVDELFDILIPKSIIKGEIEGEYFNSNNTIYPYITNEAFESKYAVANAITIEELKKRYPKVEDEENLISYYYLDCSSKIIILGIDNFMSIDLYDLFDEEQETKKTLYQKIDGEKSLILNEPTLSTLQRIQNLEELKAYLKEHSDKLSNFARLSTSDNIQNILVENGELKSFNQNNNQINIMRNIPEETKPTIDSQEYSVKGLYEYLKEHIIGHDKELKDIATILVLNYYSNPVYGTESILIPGPTGTGKTATFSCASNYFNIPFKNINTCNLVPDGIVGTTIEDEFATLIESCKGDISKAEKAILIFDEFDKLGTDSLDIKETLVNIFLKAFEGASFPINRERQPRMVYNTTLASKICLGTFTEAYKQEKNTIGFDSSAPKQAIFDQNLIVSKGYFSKELLSRIHHFIPYEDISEEDKLKIILESKLSTYILKKQRFKSQFGIQIEGDEVYAKSVLEHLKEHEKSIRDLNNIIAKSMLPIEYEILQNPDKYKTLKLTKDTVTKGDFDLS